MNRRTIVVAFIIVFLSGCAGHPYGTFADAPIGFQETMATDAVNQMENLYPPATTRLSLMLEPKDGFGQALIERMRRSGYAVYESATAPLADSAKFSYVLDTLDPTTYRLMVSVGSESLSRVYMTANHKITPSGLWTRKE